MTTATVAITEPGVYDLPADAYHADPVPGGSLSSSGARALLPPSCPALFRYERDNPPPPKTTFELGHAAHQQVLGVGPELVLVDRDRWDTKEVKATVAAIRAEGGVPLKRGDYEAVQAMAAALREHPFASLLFRPDAGEAEQSLFWVDREIGLWRRARLDWYPHWTYANKSSRLIIPDYKTCHSAAPEKLQKAIYDFGYHQQAAWYIDGVKATCPAGQHPDFNPGFVLVCQEKTPPYLVTVAEPDATALRIGAELNRRALHIYRNCVETGRWPGYSDDVELISLPGWVENRYIEEFL